ncbi:hypothetical protein B1J93_05375 [Leptospira kirschneri serovar Pomona]|uniref:Uncharacterized protein n=1 Tax=Leptospira kirschneri serovar Pomona TaxID=561005 RepID=A0A1T1DW54_9LEPT|nr:hypothetical protein B1J93_05375 [Leptospira kirschneri serovar Pomona]
MSSYNFRIVCKILICESSYVILQTNLGFVIVPTFKESIYKVQILAFFKITSFYVEFTLFRYSI